MVEQLRRHYVREEDFLDEFYNVAAAAAHFLDGEWSPNYDCDDATRENREYFLSTGEMDQLVFDGAAVYDDPHGFSSAQIVLRSAKRIVTIRVSMVGKELVAEKIVDREPSNTA